MPDSLLSRRLKLGTFLGIELFVHWTFALVVVYVGFTARHGGLPGIGFAVIQLLGVFVCVTLHEYGHAMAARRFGIATVDITLLPIGGVARLRRMPRIPWQELVVAVAGPAVNVVIATGLLAGFLFFTDRYVISALATLAMSPISGQLPDEQATATLLEVVASPSLVSFAILMLVVNIMLVVFNMIPAFPMDGGRVFRSVMAMFMEYRRATFIASRVGLVCAALMAVFALSGETPSPIPVLIAVFIAYAGVAEARQVDVMESVRGLTVGDVTIRTSESIPMDLPLSEIVTRWRLSTLTTLPVLSITGTVIGVLSLNEIKQAVTAGSDPRTTAGQLVNHSESVGTMHADEQLESALMRTGRQQRAIPVVDGGGHLVGIVDLDSMVTRGEIAKSRRRVDEQF